MTKIPRSVINEILAKTDIVEQIGSRVQLKKSGSNYVACCPFHFEKTPSFTVSPNKQFYHCFGCGAHGSSIGFLMDYEKMSFKEAVLELANALGIEVSSAPVDFQDNYHELYQIMQKSAEFYQQNLARTKVAQQYLQQRGICPEIIARYQLGFALDSWDGLYKSLTAADLKTDDLLKLELIARNKKGGYFDKFRARIIFPIHNLQGKVVAFGGRVLDDSKPKYLNSAQTPLFHKSHELYGLYQAIEKQRSLARIVVVEGYMDVIALAQHGIDYAAAVLGTAISVAHLQKLLKYSEEIIFCFDADKAGYNAALRALTTALPLLAKSVIFKFLFLKDQHDPDSYISQHGKLAFTQQLDGALTLSEFLLKHLSHKINFNNFDEKVRFLQNALPWVRQIAPGFYQDLLINEIAGLTGMNSEYIYQKLAGKAEHAGQAVTAVPRGGVGGEKITEGQLNLGLKAASILLQNPHLSRYVDEEVLQDLAALNPASHSILCEITQVINKDATINVATLAEYWRDSSLAPTINQLMVREHLISGEALEREFVEILKKVRAQKERRVNKLYRNEQLHSSEEKL